MLIKLFERLHANQQVMNGKLTSLRTYPDLKQNIPELEMYGELVDRFMQTNGSLLLMMNTKLLKDSD